MLALFWSVQKLRYLARHVCVRGGPSPPGLALPRSVRPLPFPPPDSPHGSPPARSRPVALGVYLIVFGFAPPQTFTQNTAYQDVAASGSPSPGNSRILTFKLLGHMGGASCAVAVGITPIFAVPVTGWLCSLPLLVGARSPPESPGLQDILARPFGTGHGPQDLFHREIFNRPRTCSPHKMSPLSDLIFSHPVFCWPGPDWGSRANAVDRWSLWHETPKPMRPFWASNNKNKPPPPHIL